MSRIIVKNLPSGIKEDRLRSLFSAKGHITECTPKYTKDGKFRKFAFIGYKTEAEAQAALKHFNKSYIDTSKIQVELAHDFGDDKKPRSWSKYSKDSSAYQKMLKVLEEKQDAKRSDKKKTENKRKKKENAMKELLGDIKDDPEFQEFLAAHKNRTTKATWDNEAGGESEKTGVEYDAESTDEDSEEPEKSGLSDTEETTTKETTRKKNIDKNIADKGLQPKHSFDVDDETIAESGRLFVRNLAYICTEDDLQAHFEKYGPLTEVNVPIDKHTKKIKGFAFITYMLPEHAVKAFTDMDGTSFQGRMLHILPAKAKKEESIGDESNFKKKKQAKQKASAGSSHNWNSLFLGGNAVVDVMAQKYGTSKGDILDPSTKQSLGVRMALGETQEVAETRDFLTDNGVQLDCFGQPAASKSKTVILVKNLPVGTSGEELRGIFSKFGTVGRVVLPPSGITAIVEYIEPSEARKGFTKLAYTKFQHVPLYLEWAPMEVFGKTKAEGADKTNEDDTSSSESEDDLKEVSGPGCTLFVKNLNFATNDETLKEFFSKVAKVKVATVAKKKDMKNPGNLLSMGYGFVEFYSKEGAQKALKQLQHQNLDDHTVELKMSERATIQTPEQSKKTKNKKTVQTTTKILIRNIPFEAKEREIRELFSVFGELKSVRLPKKLSGTGSHRGFGFVDFLTKQDSKRAFDALCQSTHLYGRRLVLEWADTEESVEQLQKKTAENFFDDIPRKKLKKSSFTEDLKMGTELD